eukprot:TRINITY_DN6019_c0_g1_i5.p1 TRINITY_DN6019_c0_g1~~TRINITY_DN6019_c0_g1_i5.p1  ORF type:complete len:164 (-),score=42.09 TRINITY_DN6019_c0_g1_i5:12-503(-)
MKRISGTKEIPQDRYTGFYEEKRHKDPNFDLFKDAKPEAIAQQMTRIEWKIWSQIKPYEFLDLAWTQDDRAVRAANVLAMIERFNYVSSWVATQICMEERLRDRVKLVSKLIHVAQKLRFMNNFNGLMAILSGLNRGPVYRLRQTFGELEKKKKKKKKKSTLR